MKKDININKHLGQNLQKRIDRLKEDIERFRKDLKEVESGYKDNKWHFEINVVNLWKDIGDGFLDNNDGEDIVYKNQSPLTLKEAIIRALLKFLKKNNKDLGIENISRVSVVLKNGTTIKLPKEFWEKTFKKVLKELN